MKNYHSKSNKQYQWSTNTWDREGSQLLAPPPQSIAKSTLVINDRVATQIMTLYFAHVANLIKHMLCM